MNPSRPNRDDLWTIILILLACSLFAWLRWLRINSLVTDDPALWLFQVSRAAAGEVVYRDFSWNYPPFSIWLFSAWLRIFGVSFVAAQALIDLLSLAIVLLGYWLIRGLLPRSLHFITILLLVVVLTTAQTNFSLFSFLTYSPSLLTATAGLFLLMIGVIRYFRGGTMGPLNRILIASGAFIAETSKPESLLATGTLLVALVVFDRWVTLGAHGWFASIRRHFTLLVASVLPGAIGYGCQIAQSGAANLKTGIGGYGLATFACPWWPTGLGVFGILASSAQAVVIAAIALWPLRQEFSAHTGKRYRSVLLAATPCLVLYLSYYFYLNSVELLSDDSFSHKIKSVLPRLFWTNPVFLPVMWTTVAVTVYLSVRLALRQLRPQHTVPAIEFWVFLAPGVVMSSRGFFGTTLIPITALSAVCYPFLILAAPILLWKLLSPLAPSASKPVWVVSAFVLGYVFIRLVGAYPIMLDGAGYRELATKAGAIRVRDNDGSAEIYEYVVRTTAPSDFVLCMPYCGGVNVAAQRRSPIYTVQFKQLRPSLLYQAKDVDGMKQRPPKVVIVDDAPHYGTVFGLPANMECPCPRLVWQPDQWSAKPEYVFPVVEYIQEHYRVDRKIGSRLVLIPK